VLTDVLRVVYVGIRVVGVAAAEDNMDWAQFLFLALLSWLAIALIVGTVVGHGIALGAVHAARHRA
jgi:hypothetical protein